MDKFEAAAREATSPEAKAHSRIAGIAVMSASTAGSDDYSFSAGVRSLEEGTGSAKDMTCDTVVWIASVSKLMTSVAAMSCVERDLVTLDEDITRILPELKDVRILESYDDSGEPVFTSPKTTITLRKLLSHSSGMGYDIMSPLLLKWQGGKSLAFSGSFEKGFSKLPLLYEPGESWQYSGSIDWAGQAVQRLNDNRTLGEYLQSVMWEPLGMESTTFHLESRPDLSDRLATLSNRTVEGGLSQMADIYSRSPVDDSGGAGMYSTASDVFKLLKSLLKRDGKVIKPETTDLLFTPQLGPGSVKALGDRLRNPATKLGVTVGLEDHVKLNYGLGGLLAESDVGTGRKGNSLQWGGLPNLAWWIDPAGGRCGLYVSQMMPKYDQPTIDLKLTFERAIYAS